VSTQRILPPQRAGCTRRLADRRLDTAGPGAGCGGRYFRLRHDRAPGSLSPRGHQPPASGADL